MTARARPPLQCVAVKGGGQVALLAAAALARALPGTRIVHLPTPVAPAALADRAHTTLPTLARLHARIGMDEAGMLRRAGASHRLATRYCGWLADGGDWLMGYGAAVDPALKGGFAARWAGMAVAAPRHEEAAGPAVSLAAVERFAMPSDDPASPLADLDYAMRFEPAAYLRRLASLTAHLGVETGHSAGRADLVLDCAGPPLESPIGWIDWSKELPIRGLTFGQAEPRLSVVDSATALVDGYRLASPGRDTCRLITCSTGEGAIELRPGRLAQPWQGDVVAIGDAAAAFEPIGWCNLHLAICQIELLLELLPGRDIHPLERAEYNRRAGLMADRVRDFVAAHHSLLRPELVRSPALTLTLREFQRRGRLPFFEEETIARDLWLQLLAGIGIKPGPSPRIAAMTPDAMAAAREAQIRRNRTALGASHAYPSWLSRTLEAR